MTDSDRLNARLDAQAARRAAKQRAARDPESLKRDLPDNIIQFAKRNMRNPSNFRTATDQDFATKDAEIARERLAEKSRIMLSRLPAQYRDAQLPATEEGQQAQEWLAAYRTGRRQSLIIMGPVGTGKTWIAAAIARDLMIHPRPVPTTLVTVADMLDSLRGARPGLDIDMMMYASAPVLILDDLGAESPTTWVTEQLYRLSHTRYHNGLPTILTTNLTGDEIRARYEIRIIERFLGGAARIDVVGQSRRTLPF
jgi:DNA replication protein DnaC